jgi:hypothetical protein
MVTPANSGINPSTGPSGFTTMVRGPMILSQVTMKLRSP